MSQRTKNLRYIIKNIHKCSKQDLLTIMSIFLTKIDVSRIQTSGSGSYILTENLSDDILEEVKAYIAKQNEVNRLDFSLIN